MLHSARQHFHFRFQLQRRTRAQLIVNQRLSDLRVYLGERFVGSCVDHGIVIDELFAGERWDCKLLFDERVIGYGIDDGRFFIGTHGRCANDLGTFLIEPLRLQRGIEHSRR